MSEVKKYEVKCCTSCGDYGEPYLYSEEVGRDIQEKITLRCVNVLCALHCLRTDSDTREEALELWNARPHIEAIRKNALEYEAKLEKAIAIHCREHVGHDFECDENAIKYFIEINQDE